MRLYLTFLLTITFCLNTSLCAFALPPTQKTVEISRNILSNPTQENASAFIKAMIKEYKRSYRAKQYDDALDYLRAALYFLKLNPKSVEYQENLNKFNSLVQKSGMDTSPKNRLEIAKNLVLENKYYAAAYELTTLLNEGYEPDVCYEYLGDTAKKINSEDAALSLYKRAIDYNSENLNAKYKYANELLKTGDTANSAYYFEDIIEKTNSAPVINGIINSFTEWANQHPQDENAYAILGIAYQKLGQYDKTYELLKKSLMIKPDDIFLRYHLGNLLFDINEFSFADEIFSEILENNPYESQIRIARAKTYLACDKPNKAIKDYQIVLAMYPESIQAKYGLYSVLKDKMPLERITALYYPLESGHILKEDGYNNLGYFANKLGNTKDAIIFFEKALSINPKSPIPYIELYKTYQLIGDSAKAQNILNKACKRFPKNSEIIQMYSATKSNDLDEKNSIALSYLNEGEYEKAIAMYQQVEPKTAETYEAIANCFRQLGDFNSAVSYYNKAAEMNSDNSDTYYALGVTYLEANNLTKAKAAFLKSLQKNPKNIKSKKMLSFIEQKEVIQSLDMAYEFYERQDYRTALAYLNQAVKSYPNDPKVYYYRALTKEALGDIKGAIADYRAVIHVDRNYVVAYYKLGEALERSNKLKEALYMYEKYLGAENIDKELAKQAEQKVIELGERYY